ncbi:MAG: amino acid adenylation domain-containing protein, partial [Deltaproteobacteria bacterium]
QQEVLIGTPLAGRPLSEFEDVVGYFVNLAVIRAPITPDMSFRRHIAEMREAILGGLKHGDFPFREIVKRLNPVRDNSRTPFFQVVFNLVKAAQIGAVGDMADREAGDTMRLGSLDFEPFPLEQQEGQFDLDLAVLDTGGGMPATLKYSTDLFEAGTIARMAGHFLTLLESAVANPDKRVSELPLLSEIERQEVLGFGVAGNKTYGEGLCLHERFEKQVKRTPMAVAATCEGENLSYDALNRRANRLAHQLRGLGVGPDKLVGLCVERSLDLVIGILGILKAGGAYLPIDLSYPAERVAFMLKDAEAPVLVTHRSLAENLPTRAGATVFVEEPLEGCPDTNPQRSARPDNLIYVIYTSGSTGKPKGALITHHAVDRLFRATEEWYGFGPEDVWTLFHSVAFDFSVWEFWGALIFGGRLVVVPYGISRSPEAFLELLHREEVTVLNQTPSAFRQLIQADLEAEPVRRTALRYVIFGGEALALQGLRPWFERHGDERPRLVNMYGITETCVHVTYRPISLRDLEEKKGSVIGVPIPDLCVYVLDPRSEPVPMGLPGEMYVGGPGLARGYLKRMELTAQRFVADPFCPGERLYRTGDLARWIEEGELEYLGRIDHQVKIRGFRVELGEIESVMGLHPLVRESVVVAREDVPGDKRLVGYVVGGGDEPRVREELRVLLKTNVPDYMVPSVFVFLEKLPLTSNGKVDLKALPVPEGIRPSITTLYEAPRNEVEDAIAAVWKQVLRLENIGIHDNFFDLGGHSLLLVQVQSQLEQRLKRRLAVVELFQYPSIETLAGHLTSDENVALARERIQNRADQQRQARNRRRNR